MEGGGGRVGMGWRSRWREVWEWVGVVGGGRVGVGWRSRWREGGSEVEE